MASHLASLWNRGLEKLQLEAYSTQSASINTAREKKAKTA